MYLLTLVGVINVVILGVIVKIIYNIYNTLNKVCSMTYECEEVDFEKHHEEYLKQYSEYEIENMQRRQEFNERINKIKEDLAEESEGVYNLPHEIIYIEENKIEIAD